MKLKLEVRNLDAVVANFHAKDRQLQAEVKHVVRRTGEETLERLRALCPVDTGFMRDHARTIYSEGGYAFRTGWDAADFAEAGLPPYFLYVEYGTSRSPAQPSLHPAYQETRPRFYQDLRDALRAAIRRRGPSGRATGED